VHSSENICLLVPIVVVRELDKHKWAGTQIAVSETNKEPIRTRVCVAVRRLRAAFDKSDLHAPIGGVARFKNRPVRPRLLATAVTPR
jgi:hypothetical protein